MNARGGNRVITLFLLYPQHWMGMGSQRHVPAALQLRKRIGTHFMGGWVGSRAGMDGCRKPRPHRGPIPAPTIP